MTALEAFGAELDIADTGFVAVAEGQARAKAPAFVWLDEQCDHKYLVHTAGFSYSGGELAWWPGLQPGERGPPAAELQPWALLRFQHLGLPPPPLPEHTLTLAQP